MNDSKDMSCSCDTALRKVIDYFDQGYRRSRDHKLPFRGKTVKNSSKLAAQFNVDVLDDHIRAINYKCTTCVTLIAYCERLAELATGLSLKEARQIAPPDLIITFPEVPSYKYDRANLAVQALLSAVLAVK
ncbi:MAG: hypothetical protein GY839_12795 [candidate division Zixibacteria bacterium]|nr:hypothetical protein [candidate division Zixibacteria bacterium]